MNRICSMCGIPWDEAAQRFTGEHRKWWCYGPATYAMEVAETPEEQAALDERKRTARAILAKLSLGRLP